MARVDGTRGPSGDALTFGLDGVGSGSDQRRPSPEVARLELLAGLLFDHDPDEEVRDDPSPRVPALSLFALVVRPLGGLEIVFAGPLNRQPIQ